MRKRRTLRQKLRGSIRSIDAAIIMNRKKTFADNERVHQVTLERILRLDIFSNSIGDGILQGFEYGRNTRMLELRDCGHCQALFIMILKIPK